MINFCIILVKSDVYFPLYVVGVSLSCVDSIVKHSCSITILVLLLLIIIIIIIIIIVVVVFWPIIATSNKKLSVCPSNT